MTNDPRYASGGTPADDMDADDMSYPASKGSADGHADCVPASGNAMWPGQDSDEDNSDGQPL